MKKSRKHTEDEVIKSLFKKNDCRIQNGIIYVLMDKIRNTDGNLIVNPAKKNDLGNGSWGKIDFLKKYCNYPCYEVDRF